MDTVADLSLTINGKTLNIRSADAETPLLWFIRDRLGLKGSKFGCGHGGCGACLVLANGQTATSCNHPAKDFVGKKISTIEGIAREHADSTLRAWIAEQVPQCGYCQPGMIIAATALLALTPHPTDAEIDLAMAPVLCRCGTYPRVRRAVHRAADRRWRDTAFPNETVPIEEPAVPMDALQFNPWVKIACDGTVIVVIGQAEMGQGVTTSLMMLVAEELEIPLGRVRTELGPTDHAYDNPVLHMQITVGSLSIQTNWERMRRAGAEVRERLLAAAAAHWLVPISSCCASEGNIIHEPTGRRLDYGFLAGAAAALRPPSHPKLKDFESFSLLGKPTARRDIPAHIMGRTIFGLDVNVPGLLTATVLMSPRIGAKVDHIDITAAAAIDGVRNVLEITGGVAVLAENHYTAMRGREALRVSWTGGLAGLSSDQLTHRFRQALERDGEPLQERGNTAMALQQATKTIEAEYETPYLAHAAIEPINCTAHVRNGQCDIWIPTQRHALVRQVAAKAAGIPPDKVRVHSTFLGGGFGRRTEPDVVTQAVEISKAAGKPVQVLWPRAEEMRHDCYRPASFARLKAGIDAHGDPVAWLHRVAGPELAGEGIEIAYNIANLRTEHVLDDPGVPSGYWRSVGASQNAFAIESFVDELAAAAGTDPLHFRMRHLDGSPRLRAVLALAAAKGDWDKPPSQGRTRGVAAYHAHGGWAAQIAEISITRENALKIHRITCAVDCGFVVNPDTVRAQLEGAVVFGLTAALKSAITIFDGEIQQTDFHDYPLLNIAETPDIEVHIMPSREQPSGAGECGVPPVAPAITNAVFAATGKRIRRLPIQI